MSPFECLSAAVACLIGGAVMFDFGDSARAIQADALEVRQPYGYVEAGGCMSRDRFHRMSELAMFNVDWGKIQGSADFDRATVAKIWVYRSMKRLGTPACADLATLYRILDQWAAKPLISASDIPSIPNGPWVIATEPSGSSSASHTQ
jgi:hypothetical protein